MSRTSTGVDEPRSPKGIVDKAKALPQDAQLLLERTRARSGVVDVVVRTFKRYSEDDAGTYAAALTYYAFFAIFPLLLFAAAGLGYATFGNEQLTQRLIAESIESVPLIRDALTPEGLTLIQENKDALAGVGLGLALYTGTGMIVALEHALNNVLRVPKERNWFQKRLKAVRWLAILGIAAAGSLAMTSMAAALDGVVAKVFGYLGAFAIDVFIFATAFKFLPALKTAWRDVLPGALVAAASFGVLKGLGAAYLAQGEATRNATYGTLAGAATLLVASYLISQVVLLAAEVNATLIERRATRTKASDRTEEVA
ncbi:MAG: YihY/virulence factor BrkB family protein [Actinobacteria bacterium]|nr:YihY/virulence factor BrkB family protein [Actinomycetota bacterium]